MGPAMCCGQGGFTLPNCRRIEAEAEAARKQRYAVTLDLLGRRVMAADGAAAAAGGGASFRTEGDALVAAFDPRARDTQGAMWQQPAVGAGSSVVAGDKRGAAAGGGGGGVTVAEEALEADVRRAVDSLRSLRASANPHLPSSVSRPVFVQQQGQPQAKSKRGGAEQAHENTAAGRSGAGQDKGAARGRVPQPAQVVSRLQTNLTEAFDEFGEQVGGRAACTSYADTTISLALISLPGAHCRVCTACYRWLLLWCTRALGVAR